jgi:hypothetical protein
LKAQDLASIRHDSRRFRNWWRVLHANGSSPWLRDLVEILDSEVKTHLIWEYDLEVNDVKRYIYGDDIDQKRWAIGRVLKYAQWSDVRKLLTVDEIEEALPHITLPERGERSSRDFYRPGNMPASILTSLQRQVLTSFFQNDLGQRGYYLTGGTALAEFYLRHRHSDDLDFFTRRQDRLDQDFRHFLDLIPAFGLTISSDTISGDYLKIFVRTEGGDQEELKLNSHEMYRHKWHSTQFKRESLLIHLRTSQQIKSVRFLVASPLSQRFLRFVFHTKAIPFTLDYLISRAREKEALLDTEDGILLFAANLLTVQNFALMRKLEPRMIKPVSAEELHDFLVPLATELSQRFRPGHR